MKPTTRKAVATISFKLVLSRGTFLCLFHADIYLNHSKDFGGLVNNLDILLKIFSFKFATLFLMKRKNFFLITLLIVFLVFASLAFFLWNNISLFGLNSKKSEISTNNSSSEGGDYVELFNKKIEVPQKYANGVFDTERKLNLPQDFKISVFANGMVNPREIAIDKDDNLYVSDLNGKVYFLPDGNKDGVADEVIEFDKSLRNPHGIIFHNGDLYVGETNEVVVYRTVIGKNYSKKEVLVKNLPADGGHSTRTLAIGPDNKLYISVGSSCNLCEEKDPRRAAIVRYNLDGSGEEVYASGLRNSVGMIFHDGVIWSVDNGRDLIGDNLPPEEVNVVDKKGNHYGWPFCYGNQVPNPEYSSKVDFCKTTIGPKYEMPAHSAPLSLSFIDTNVWPEVFAKDLVVSFHGSWNRTTPTGYKLIRIDNQTGNQVNFITGWLQDDGNAWGRPVGVKFDKNGTMFIADDKAGVIYRLWYEKGCDSETFCKN